MPRNKSAVWWFTGQRILVFIAFLFAAVVLAGARRASAGEQGGRIFFPDYLPSNTILCVVPPDNTSVEQDYSRTIFARLANLPEMGPFLTAFEESRRSFAKDIAETAKIPPQLVQGLVGGRLALAVMNVGMGRDRKSVV